MESAPMAYGEYVEDFSEPQITAAKAKLAARIVQEGLKTDEYRFRKTLAWNVALHCQVRRIDAIPKENLDA